LACPQRVPTLRKEKVKLQNARKASANLKQKPTERQWKATPARRKPRLANDVLLGGESLILLRLLGKVMSFS
jgi:hypothetical protein